MKTILLAAVLSGFLFSPKSSWADEPPIVPPSADEKDRRYEEKFKAIEQRFSAQEKSVETALIASDKRYEQRFAAQEKAVEAALQAAEKAVAAALQAAKEAVDKAEIANAKRFESVNEFRGQLKDQAATLLPRTEFDDLRSRFEKLEGRFANLEGEREGKAVVWAAVIVLAGFGLTILTIFLARKPPTKDPVNGFHKSHDSGKP